MSAWDPDLLEREADERQRTLDAEYDAHLLDQTYNRGTRHGMACLTYLLGLWLDAVPDRDAEWTDRVWAEVVRLEAAGMPNPLPEAIERLVRSDC